MRQATGILTVVQESRFQLHSDGRSQLFVVDRRASIEPQDLTAMLESNARVTVHYDRAEGRIVGVAHDISMPGDLPRRQLGRDTLARRRS